MFAEQTWIFKRAALSNHKTALIDVHTGDQWTYQQLTEHIHAWRIFLEGEGCQKGDRIAVVAQNRIELFAILFACSVNGYIYVPINWRLSKKELQCILEDCQPTILLYDKENEHTIDSLRVSKKHSLDITYRCQMIEDKLMEVSPTSTWMIIYTGGTTGKPKGVVLSHKAINWNAMNTIVSWSLCENDCTLNYMPLFHTGGLNALCIPLLMVGGTIVIGRKFDSLEAVEAINTFGTTISLFVPTMHQAIIDTPYFQTEAFPTVKVFLSGGAPCPNTIYEAYKKKGLPFKEGYGLTEAGPNNFFIRPETALKKQGSVGKCMQFIALKVVNEQGSECAVNEVGELFIAGKHLFSCYWQNEEETAKTLVDGWLRTGDLARKDEDGDYYIVGRKKEMIITGGENVYPQEVEQCLLLHESVKEVAVVGVEDSIWGECVTAFIVPSNRNYKDAQLLIEYCKHELGSYKAPKKILFVDELPKTHVGKINKKALLQFVQY